MSRFLPGFRASQAAAAETRFSAANGHDNPEKGGNPIRAAVALACDEGFRGCRDCRDHTVEKTVFLVAAGEAGAEALREPNRDFGRERAEIAAALAAEAGGEFGKPTQSGHHRKALDGLLHDFAGAGRQPRPEMLA